MHGEWGIMRRIWVMLTALPLLLAGCIDLGTPATNYGAIGGLSSQFEEVVERPEHAQFFAIEAASARVSDVIAVRYDATRYNKILYNPDQRTSQIMIYVDRDGAREARHIAHILARAYARQRGCTNHGRAWVEAFMGIAGRFERTFPAEQWGGMSPTAYAVRRAERYRDQHC